MMTQSGVKSIERGDVVLCAVQGDYGKPRPAVVVQSDIFNQTHDSITICPMTTHLVHTGLFRISIVPVNANGLNQASEVMIDKVTSIKREKIREKIGQLSFEQMSKISEALRFWQDLD